MHIPTSSISEIRQSLLDGHSGEAIFQLKNTLRQSDAYTASLQTVEVLEANYNATRTQELKGILTFQEAQKTYNQINDSLLTLLRDIESGKAEAQTVSKRKSGKMIFVLGALVLIALFFAWRYLMPSGESCPTFPDKGVRVLIFPFYKIRGESNDVAVSIQQDIQVKTQGKMPVNVKVFTKHPLDQLEDPETIKKIVAGCNADLVIWGTYSYEANNLQVASRHYVTALDSTIFSPFQSAFSLNDDNKGRKDRKKEDVVFSICSVLAVMNKNMPLAMNWISKTTEKNETDMRIEALSRETPVSRMSSETPVSRTE